MFAYALRLPSRMLIGGCEVRRLPDDALNVSYWLYPQYRGKGYISRAMLLLCEALSLLPDVRQIEAHVEADNAASRQVAVRAGFRESGIVTSHDRNDCRIARIRYAKVIAR